MKCHFGCGNNVDPQSRYTWHRVVAWERPGKTGGSDIALRERQRDLFACDACVRRQQRGVSPLQETLV